jgi:hypothetical protein
MYHFLCFSCCSSLTLLELPDVPLIRVLYFIDLEDLLLVVNRVCKRLNDIIKYSAVLWTVFEFYDPLNITESDLPCILKHSKKFRVFNIGLSNYTGRLAQLDYFLVTSLSSSKNLIWLTLTGIDISTTCFLQYLPNLEILDLSQCNNLNDCDFSCYSLLYKTGGTVFSIQQSPTKDYYRCHI